MAIDIGKSFRRAGANILNYATQKQLLEKEKRQLARDKAQESLRRSMEKISGLDTPAGVAATQGLVGDIFDPEQELNFRRLQTVLKPGLQYEQTELVNPALTAAGFTGKAAPSALSAERVITEKKRGEALEQLSKKREQERKQAEAESKFRVSKIEYDMKQSKAALAKTLAGTKQGIASGAARSKDLMNSYKQFEMIEKEYKDRLDELQSLPDFSSEDEETGETIFNEKYTKQVREIQSAHDQARAAKDAIIREMLQATPEAQAIDAATGGAITGRAAVPAQRAAAPAPRQVPISAQLPRGAGGEVRVEDLLQAAGLSGRTVPQTAEPESLRALKEAQGKSILDLIGPRTARAESVTAPSVRVRAADVPVAQAKDGVIKTPDGYRWRYDEKTNRYVQVK